MAKIDAAHLAGSEGTRIVVETATRTADRLIVGVAGDFDLVEESSEKDNGSDDGRHRAAGMPLGTLSPILSASFGGFG